MDVSGQKPWLINPLGLFPFQVAIHGFGWGLLTTYQLLWSSKCLPPKSPKVLTPETNTSQDWWTSWGLVIGCYVFEVESSQSQSWMFKDSGTGRGYLYFAFLGWRENRVNCERFVIHAHGFLCPKLKSKWCKAANLARWCFVFHPYLGRWSKLTNVCFMGWNHEPARVYIDSHVQSKNLTPYRSNCFLDFLLVPI